MSVTLYDLVGTDDRRFSPHCWRTRMALAHKGLEVETVPTLFTEIATICGGGQKTVPVIEDAGNLVADSWVIANYLEATYDGGPSLFPEGESLTLFVHNWANTTLHPVLSRLIILDIFEHLDPRDQDYFRETRERRFGATLEECQAGRDERLPKLQATLAPVRLGMQEAAFLCGDDPGYADYVVFGSLQWARCISPFRLLEKDDPVLAWFNRCLDLFDGLGRKAPGYD